MKRADFENHPLFEHIFFGNHVNMFVQMVWFCLVLNGFHVFICVDFLPCPSNFCSNISSMINGDVSACSNA